MRHLALSIAVLLAGCASNQPTGPTSTERMQGDIGKPIAIPITRNGPPETVVRLNDKQLAYTFLKKGSGITGGAIRGGGDIIRGDPINSYSWECRFTLIVDAPRDNMGVDEMMVVDFVPPKPECD